MKNNGTNKVDEEMNYIKKESKVISEHTISENYLQNSLHQTEIISKHIQSSVRTISDLFVI